MNSKIIKNLVSRVEKSSFPKFWEKYKLVVGYTVAIAIAAVFLLCFSFNWLFFAFSLFWGFSFIRLKNGFVAIENSKVVDMWCIFCFGLSGIVMQVFQIGDYNSVGVLVAGIVMSILYRCIPMFSYYLKYNDKLWGFGFNGKRWTDTKFNGFLSSAIFLAIMFLSSIFIDMIKMENKELSQQLKTEQFVPVKKISEEIYNGSTIYILEAKGQRFMVQPIEYPEVRDINPKSQVKVIFDKHNTVYQMKCVKEIEFKN